MKVTWTSSTQSAVASPGARPGILGWRKWRLWVLGFDVMILGGMAVLWHWPLVKVKDIRVEGPAVWEEQARSLVVLPPDSNFLRVDPDATRLRLAASFGNLAVPQVTLELPSTLLICLVPTTPVLWAEGAATNGQLAVGADGALLTEPLDRPALPIWRTAAGAPPAGAFSQRARFAAGSWAEIIDADDRYQQAISEWTRDSRTGWVMTAADGRSQIIIGKTGLKRRAAEVARLLDEGDSLLLRPCVIDARFEGLLAVRPLPEPANDSTVTTGDSLASGKAQITSKNGKPPKPDPAKATSRQAPRRSPVRIRNTRKGTA